MTVQINDYRITPGARVSRSTVQSITTAVWTAVLFDTVVFDPWGMYQPTNTTARLFCLVPGYYLVGGAIFWVGNTTGDRGIAIVKNAAVFDTSQLEPPLTAATNSRGQGTSTLLYLSVGDTVEMQVFQNTTGGGNLNINTNATLWAMRLNTFGQ